MKKENINNILIVGATGFIGSHLLRLLLKQNYNIIILKRSFDATERIIDLLNKVKVYDIDLVGLELPFSENKIDLVINLVTDFGKKEDSKPSEVVDTNIVFALKLLENSKNGAVKHYFTMDSALSPDVSLYAYTKKVLKQILQNYSKQKINIFNLRLEHVYGGNDDLFKFVPFAISKMKKNETLNMTKGKQELDLIFIDDCVDAIIYIIQNIGKYGSNFNDLQIGTGKTIFLRDFIELIKEALKSDSIINYGAVPYRKNEQMFSQADISTLKGWKPKHTVKETVKILIK